MSPTDFACALSAIGLNQAEAAAALSVSESTITSWVSGRRRPAPTIFNELAALSATIDKRAAARSNDNLSDMPPAIARITQGRRILRRAAAHKIAADHANPERDCGPNDDGATVYYFKDETAYNAALDWYNRTSKDEIIKYCALNGVNLLSKQAGHNLTPAWHDSAMELYAELNFGAA